MEAFRAALAAGMDGFELDVQPTRDGVCMVLHDDTLDRTSLGSGVLRQLKAGDLPNLKNGEAVPRLGEALELEARLINVELKGEPGWQQALATVEAAEVLDRVIFSSFEHSEVLQLWSACPQARCGFLWNTLEAADLSAEELEDLPSELYLHAPLAAVQIRTDLWAPFASRLVLWGMNHPNEAEHLPFSPYALISNDRD
jgi:glycerophosphoryl diester phosphodiesterase